MPDPLLLPLLSFGVGILVGLTGIGGASLMTPMLIFIFQVPPSIAISSDVVAASLMKIVGGWKHFRQKTVDWQIVKYLASGSVPGALIGVGILHSFSGLVPLNRDTTLLRLVGFAILIVSIAAIAQLALAGFNSSLQLPELPKLNLNNWLDRIIAIGIGAALGCIVGLTSVSSGALFALTLLALFKLDADKLVGTDIIQAAILLTFTSLGHLSLGTVNWQLVTAIWLGSIPGVMIGAKLCQLAPQRLLRFAICILLMMVSWKLTILA